MSLAAKAKLFLEINNISAACNDFTFHSSQTSVRPLGQSKNRKLAQKRSQKETDLDLELGFLFEWLDDLAGGWGSPGSEGLGRLVAY